MPSDRDRTAERDAAEALRRYWDGLADGRAATPNGLDPAHAATIDRLHALDDAPAADPAFARRLAADLMGQAAGTHLPDRTPAGVGGWTMDTQTPPRPLGSPASSVRAIPIVPTGHAAVETVPATLTATPRPVRRGSNRWWPRLEYAAAVLLIVGLLGAALGGTGRLNGNGGSDQRGVAETPPLSLAAIASPGGKPDTSSHERLVALPPAPGGCQVEPRTAEELRQLAASTPNATPASGPGLAVEPGVPADAATIDGVTATVSELSACNGAGDNLRYLALLSDNALRAVVNGVDGEPGLGREGLVALAMQTPSAATRDLHGTMIVRDVRVLPDGRVRARLSLDLDNEDAPLDDAYSLFVRVGDRWLIDGDVSAAMAAADPVPAATPATPATPKVLPEGCRGSLHDETPAATPATPDELAPASTIVVAGVCVTASPRQGVTVTVTERGAVLFAGDLAPGQSVGPFGPSGLEVSTDDGDDTFLVYVLPGFVSDPTPVGADGPAATDATTLAIDPDVPAGTPAAQASPT